MSQDVDALVRRVLRHGIMLKDRLRLGETFDLRNEQAVLKRMLLTEEQAAQLPDYSSDAANAPRDLGFAGTMTPAERTPPFLGIRYALVCWLDEMFLIDSPWDSQWNEFKLEQSLYGSNDRAWKFWEQAKIAEKRPGRSALRAFFFCVMLGFRGDYRDDIAFLGAWTDAARRRLADENAAEWPMPPDREVHTSVPPLFGRDALRRMVMSCGTLLLILVPLVAFFFVQYLDRNTPGLSASQSAQKSGYGRDAKDKK
jgi:type VI secretion system protein ImpK